MKLLFLPHLASGCLLIILGALIYLRGRNVKINQLFALLCVTLSFWFISFSISQHASTLRAFLLWERIGYIGVTFTPAIYFHFAMTYAKPHSVKWRILSRGYYLYAVIFIMLVAFTDLFPHDVYTYWWGIYPQGNLLILLSVVTSFIGIVASYMVFISACRQARQRMAFAEYNRLKCMCIALGIFAWVTLDFLPKFGIGIYPIGFLAVDIFALLIAYAIVKYQLFDINVIFRKSLVYSILVTFITVMYLVFVVSAEKLLQGVMGYRAVAPSLLAACIIAIGFTPLKNWIQSFVDRYFFKGTQAGLAAENARMRQELERSERLKAVGVLAAGLAHEIKNPLSAIKTFTEYVSQKRNDPVFLEKFQRIVGTELGKINQIVQDLLEFAKPSPLQREPVRMSQLLDETLELLSHDLVKHRVAVERRYDADDTVFVDRERMKQVCLNLFLNSLDAMNGNAHGTLTITTARNSAHADITIADTGCGIPPEKLPHIFDPFVTDKPHGTGLGLSIVHGIIQQHGGQISIKSRLGEGTRIGIELPLAQRES